MKLEDISSGDALYAAMAAQNALEECTKVAITASLRELLPAYSDHVSLAAETAKAAEEALSAPEAALEVLRGELGVVQGKAREVALQLEAACLEDRIEARVRLAAYEAEIGLINEKILRAEQDLVPLIEKRNEAVAKAESALAGMLNLGDAMSRPFEHELAQATDAYRSLRMPQLWTVIVAGVTPNTSEPSSRLSSSPGSPGSSWSPMTRPHGRRGRITAMTSWRIHLRFLPPLPMSSGTRKRSSAGSSRTGSVSRSRRICAG